MALFGFGKKKEEAKEVCCCGGAQTPEAKTDPVCDGGECRIKSIKVLGSGCKNCHALNEAVIAAVKELGMGLEVEYVTDMEIIAGYGVMSMPALVINGKVVSMGKVLKTAEVIKLLQKLGYC